MELQGTRLHVPGDLVEALPRAAPPPVIEVANETRLYLVSLLTAAAPILRDQPGAAAAAGQPDRYNPTAGFDRIVFPHLRPQRRGSVYMAFALTLCSRALASGPKGKRARRHAAAV